MNDRRINKQKSVYRGMRLEDKLFSFAVFLLLVFLLQLAFGCAAVSKGNYQARPSIDCRKHPDAFRCTPYMPEKEIDYESVDAVDVEAYEF